MCKIKIVGCGGSGTNVLNSLLKRDKLTSEKIEFYLVNSDAGSLKKSDVSNKILIGNTGLGCGGDTERAKRYLEQSNNEIKNILTDTDLLILTTGMGGGIGTTSVCEIAKIAKEQDIPTIAVVTTPFTMEGLQRTNTAETGIKELNEYINAIVVLKNNDVFNYIDENTSLDTIFSFIDGVIIGIINSTIKIINNNDTAGIDINDLKKFIKDSKQVTFKKGVGETIKTAFNNAIGNNICIGFDVSKSEHILLTVISNTDLTVSNMTILNNEIKNKFPNSKFCKIQTLQQSNIKTVQVIMLLSF